MVECKICNKKYVSQGKYETHYSKVHVSESVAEVVNTEVKEIVKPLVEAVAETQSNKITLRFKQPIEVFINSKPYVGRVIEVEDISIAAEIVRIARESAISMGKDGDILER